MNDFSVLKIIGKGAFGEVRIVKEKATGLIFAMKTMVKQLMIQKGQTEHLIAERDLMVDASGCHFLVQLIRSFQVKCLFSSSIYWVDFFLLCDFIFGLHCSVLFYFVRAVVFRCA